MKGNVKSSDLEKILAAAAQISKSPDPVRIVLERIGEPIETIDPDLEDRPTEAGQLRLVAYNDAVVAEWRIPAEIVRAGSVALVLEPFHHLVRASKGSEADLVVETAETENENVLRVTTSRSAHEFPLHSEAIFEKVCPGHTPGNRADLGNLARAIETAKIAAANHADAAGPKIALSGIHMRMLEETLDVVGADGKRLALSSLKRTDLGAVVFSDPEVDRVTIPSALTGQVCAMLNSGPARLEVIDNRVVIESSSGSLSIKLIDPPYPDYLRLLDPVDDHHLVLSKPDLEIALNRSSVSLAKDRNTVAVKLTSGEDGVYVTSSAAGQSSSECVSEKPNPAAEIGFDPRYMLPALNAYGKGDVKLSFAHHTKPIHVLSESRPEVIMLVMPCKI